MRGDGLLQRQPPSPPQSKAGSIEAVHDQRWTIATHTASTALCVSGDGQEPTTGHDKIGILHRGVDVLLKGRLHKCVVLLQRALQIAASLGNVSS